MAPASAGSGLPARIVSTAPSLTEILFALGLGPRVVGATTYCNYPEEARRVPRIGTYIQPNLETIVSLRPDLVVIEANPIRLRERLEGLGLKVLELEQRTVTDVFRAIERIGEATGAYQQARALEARIRSDLAEIGRKTAGRKRRRMAFIVGRTPGTLEGLIAVGSASYLNELITLAGGENVFGAVPAPYPKVSLEEILARNPEVIIDMGEMGRASTASEAERRRVVELWSRYGSLAAVRERRVFAVASDLYVIPGPRMSEAARELARMLQPEAGL
jgi:iron complex transport system substrate-binding protein